MPSGYSRKPVKWYWAIGFIACFAVAHAVSDFYIHGHDLSDSARHFDYFLIGGILIYILVLAWRAVFARK